MGNDGDANDWCGLAGRHEGVHAAAALALEGHAEALAGDCWTRELEPALTSLETCRALYCDKHKDADAARRLLDRVIYERDCAECSDAE